MNFWGKKEKQDVILSDFKNEILKKYNIDFDILKTNYSLHQVKNVKLTKNHYAITAVIAQWFFSDLTKVLNTEDKGLIFIQ